ncbi:MAG: FAD-binding protein [Streptosporangiaceae bacterium]
MLVRMGLDGCVILSLARMTEITELDPVNELAVAQAGVINADLDRAAAPGRPCRRPRLRPASRASRRRPAR